MSENLQNLKPDIKISVRQTFNLDTDKLLIMIYPPGGGGNLINVCLSIHPFVLNQHDLASNQQRHLKQVEPLYF